MGNKKGKPIVYKIQDINDITITDGVVSMKYTRIDENKFREEYWYDPASMDPDTIYCPRCARVVNKEGNVDAGGNMICLPTCTTYNEETEESVIDIVYSLLEDNNRVIINNSRTFTL